MNNGIRLENISRRYPESGFCLEIPSLIFEPGQVHALLGPNGSGKTTLLRLMAGEEQLDQGRIECGRSIRTGYLEQTPYLFDLSVFDNIALGLRFLKTPKEEIKRRVLGIMERLGISDLSHAPIRNLSGGERQRAAIAQVLVLDPMIMILDEPFAGLDKTGKTIVSELIKELGETGDRLIVMTGHSAECEALAGTRCIRLMFGKLMN